MKNKFNFFYFIFTVIILIICTNAFALKLKDNPEVQDFINQMVQEHHFNRGYLNNLFAPIQPDFGIIAKMEKPYEAQPWNIYREHFISDKKIHGGVLYWGRHRTALKEAEKQYGVPASIIVAIIGVESNYARVTLKYKVLNALTTLAFYYPPRAAYFKKELVGFLLMTRELQLNPRKIHGSYAGAIGVPQFMPSNCRNYAVSFWHNGQRDLVHDSSDVMVSIANFLKQHGWHDNEPIAIPAEVTGEKYQELLVDKHQAQLTIEQLADYDVRPAQELKADLPVRLITLDNKKGSEYWLGFHNFSVLMKYNTNKQYAMVVYQLAAEVQKAKNMRQNRGF